jgi:enoyl-CoA hydratase/carnithine racemase
MADATVNVEDLAEVGLKLGIEASVAGEVSGQVATVTLAKPERRNAQTPGMWRALARIGDTLPESVRVVVLRGEGPSFSAGIDVRAFTPEGIPGEGPAFGPGTTHDQLDELIDEYQRGFTWLRRPEITSVAVVQGHAIGAGFQLALSCDLRIAAEDARFCMKEPALGLVPDLTGTKPLVDAVGLARATELCLTARTVEAPEALSLGLVQWVVAHELLDKAVSDLTEALLKIDRGAATATKRLLQGAAGRTLDEQRAAERAEQTVRILGARV